MTLHAELPLSLPVPPETPATCHSLGWKHCLVNLLEPLVVFSLAFSTPLKLPDKDSYILPDRRVSWSQQRPDSPPTSPMTSGLLFVCGSVF